MAVVKPYLVAVLTALIALGAYLYQFVAFYGAFRVIEPFANTDCKKIEGLTACEKLVILPHTGDVYLACSTIENRMAWLPYYNFFNPSGKRHDDFVAVYNPDSQISRRLQLEGFTDSRGLNVHGMDVVVSLANPLEVFVFLVNHRPPIDHAKASLTGADSVIEVFRSNVASDVLHHIHTFESEVIDTPNDLIGSFDGKSLYFTNDHGSKTGKVVCFPFSDFHPPNEEGPHTGKTYLGFAHTSVGYCHVDEGCKYAARTLRGSNGIVKDHKGNIYVAASRDNKIEVFQEQADHTLVLTDVIRLDRSLDNLSVDEEGSIYATTVPNAFHRNIVYTPEADKRICPSSVHKISLNTGESSYFGEKYKVAKIFEDDGQLASASTTANVDLRRRSLYVHGVFAPHLLQCKL